MHKARAYVGQRKMIDIGKDGAIVMGVRHDSRSIEWWGLDMIQGVQSPWKRERVQEKNLDTWNCINVSKSCVLTTSRSYSENNSWPSSFQVGENHVTHYADEIAYATHYMDEIELNVQEDFHAYDEESISIEDEFYIEFITDCRNNWRNQDGFEVRNPTS